MTDGALYTPQQVAARISVPLKTVHAWLRSGYLPGIKLSPRHWRVDPADLSQWIDARRPSNRPTDGLPATSETLLQHIPNCLR